MESVIPEIKAQALEVILTLSSQQIAGIRTPGKVRGVARFTGNVTRALEGPRYG